MKAFLLAFISHVSVALSPCGTVCRGGDISRLGGGLKI